MTGLTRLTTPIIAKLYFFLGAALAAFAEGAFAGDLDAVFAFGAAGAGAGIAAGAGAAFSATR